MPTEVRDLLIVGVGVHAAEMAELVVRANSARPAWRLLGFLSPDGKNVGQEMMGRPVLGGLDALVRYPDAALVPDDTLPKDVDLPRERLANLVDPSVHLSATASLGGGCVLFPHGYVGLNARLGNYVFCLAGFVINHDDVIGNRVILCSQATLAGSVRVEDGCYLGQSCTVRQRLTVGKDSLVGMGAVVVKDVPPASVVVGNPARILKQRPR